MKIQIKDVFVLLGGKTILNKINLDIADDEQWAIIGNSGSGKTTLARAICQKIFFRGKIEISTKGIKADLPNIFLIEQQHRFKNKSNVENFYYQQRFNSADTEDTITVEEALFFETKNSADINKWSTIFSIDKILKKPLIQLSNGENKRVQLTKAILNKPDLIILDNPFVGLDEIGRSSLQDALNQINKLGIKIILIASEKDLPNCITHLAILENGIISSQGKKESTIALTPNKIDQQLDLTLLKECYKPQNIEFELAVKMVNVNINYGTNKILCNINWQIKKGEKWCVSGQNGSGKSTLLSLITADNPQAFANEIYLFDKKKGSGESIWDIKKKIGYLSPELHLFFNKGETCFQTVASGLFDTIGLFRIPDDEQKKMVLNWMKLLNIESFAEKMLHQLSLGEQRLVMLARAIVKSPSLLILDEPCQGLDEEQSKYIRSLIDHIFSSEESTLIYISHYKQDIPDCVNHFLKLENGKIIQ